MRLILHIIKVFYLQNICLRVKCVKRDASVVNECIANAVNSELYRSIRQ